MPNSAPAKVVELDAFRKRRKTTPLPLFDEPSSVAKPAGPAMRTVRSLQPREVEHRQRMLRHLSGAMLSECR